MSGFSCKKVFTRRDRRKAKASGYAREGTAKPKRKGHHIYSDPFRDTPINMKVSNQAPKRAVREVVSTGKAVTRLGRLLREAMS